MAKSQIIKDLATEKVSLSSAFHRLMIIASDIGSVDLMQWAEKELNGYQKYNELPEYRKLNLMNFQYTGINGSFQVTNVSLPLGFLKPSTLKKVSAVGIFDGIAELERNAEIKEVAYRDVSYLAGEIYEESGGVQCISVRQIIPTQQYTKILSNIKTRLLGILLKIDKEYGNMDDLDVAISDKDPEMIKKINISIEKMITQD